jgi:hypothetical protein
MEPPPPPRLTMPLDSPEFRAEGFELAQILLEKYKDIKERERRGQVSSRDFVGIPDSYNTWRKEAVDEGLAEPLNRVRGKEPCVSLNRAWFLNSIGKNWLNRIIRVGHLRHIRRNEPIIELFDWTRSPILPITDRWLLLRAVVAVGAVDEVDELDEGVAAINFEERVVNAEERVVNAEERVVNAEERVVNLEERLVNLEERLVNLEERCGRMTAQTNHTDTLPASHTEL